MAPKRYRFAASSSPNLPDLTVGSNNSQLGITLWRLQPASASADGQRIQIRENGRVSEWLPERVEMDTPLAVGDRVRLSIESPREGYLYVVSRDLFRDEKMGSARLIFPKPSGGADNRVRAGKLIDLPGQEDSPNYFAAGQHSANQIGEILSIIVTDAPLDLKSGRQPLVISDAELMKWEKTWGSEYERFELEGGAGAVWTKEEKEAASITAPRQMTQDQARPQTLYQIFPRNQAAFLINVRLTYAR
jgi:hypothetical protein